MSNFKGRRMVSEDLIKKLENLQPGGGGEYTAGTGIEISAQNEISIDTDTVATKSELFSGDYDDLTNKPDLSVYELAADAFSGDYDDLTNKPDLSVYELAADAFSGDYNDLTNKPTIPAAVSGTNDGTNWTSLTIGTTTKLIPQGGSGSADEPGIIRLPLDKCQAYGPVSTDQADVTAWLKTLPIFVARKDEQNAGVPGTNYVKDSLVAAGIPADNIYTHWGNARAAYEISGYFALVKETQSSPYSATKLIIFIPENRTGTNTLVLRSCRNGTRLYCTNDSSWRIEDSQYRGENTSLSTAVDVFNNSIIVYSKSGGTGRDLEVDTKDASTAEIKNQFAPIIMPTPTGAESPYLEIPKIDGQYVVEVSSTGGAVSLTAASTPTLTKTTETLTFTYSDNTTGTLTVVTDVSLS